MKTYWHPINFNHTCGLKGTILEVCVSRDGGISIGGICVVCGEDIHVEDNMATLIAKSAVGDYLKYQVENPEDIMVDYVPVGRPS